MNKDKLSSLKARRLQQVVKWLPDHAAKYMVEDLSVMQLDAYLKSLGVGFEGFNADIEVSAKDNGNKVIDALTADLKE